MHPEQSCAAVAAVGATLLMRPVTNELFCTKRESMSIVYALVARNQHVLCEHTDKSGNFPTVTRAVLKHLSDHEASHVSSPAPVKSVFPYNEYNFFFLHDDGLTYMCMAEDQVHASVAFMMLSDVKAAFLAQYKQQTKTALAYAMAAFSSTLDTLMKKYDNYKVETPLSQVHQKMERVKMIMIDNVNQLMERGEKIDLLVMRTDKLQQDAMKYEKTAKKLKNVYWWKNMKYWVCLFFLACVLSFVISFLICGIDFSSCGARIESASKDQIGKATGWATGVAGQAKDAVDTAATSVPVPIGVVGGSA